MTDDQTVDKAAKYGERMIEVKLLFWTNNIAENRGRVIPKHSWDSGMVRMERNSVHGIKPGKPLPFHSLMEIGAAIEKVLVAHGIRLHLNKRSQRYLAAPPNKE